MSKEKDEVVLHYKLNSSGIKEPLVTLVDGNTLKFGKAVVFENGGSGSAGATGATGVAGATGATGVAGTQNVSSVTLNATQLANLYITPVELVPTPGIGKFIIPTYSIQVLNNTGADVSVDGQVFNIKDAANSITYIYAPASVLQKAAPGSSNFALAMPESTVANYSTSFVENQALVFTIDSPINIPGAIVSSSIDTGGKGWEVNDTFNINTAEGVVDTVSDVLYNINLTIKETGTILSVNQGNKSFTFNASDGDFSLTHIAGSKFTVVNSTGNNGIYTISSTSYDDPNMTFVVNENIPSAVADGGILVSRLFVDNNMPVPDIGSTITISGSTSNDGQYTVGATYHEAHTYLWFLNDLNDSTTDGAVFENNAKTVTAYHFTNAGTDNIIGSQAATNISGNGTGLAINITELDYSVNPITLKVKTPYVVMDV